MRHTLKSQSDKILQLEHQAVRMPQIHRAEIDRLYERARYELRLSEQKMAGVLRKQMRQQGGTTVNVGRSLRQMPTTYQVPKRGGPTWLGQFLGSIPFLMAMVAAGIALTVLLASIYPAWLPEAILSGAVVSLLKVMAVVGLMGLFVTAVWELRR